VPVRTLDLTESSQPRFDAWLDRPRSLRVLLRTFGRRRWRDQWVGCSPTIYRLARPEVERVRGAIVAMIAENGGRISAARVV
jgi:hypothetical protein